MDAALRLALEQALGSDVTGEAPVHGGDVAPAHLVLEWIDAGQRADATERDLGRGLARLHQAG